LLITMAMATAQTSDFKPVASKEGTENITDVHDANLERRSDMHQQEEEECPLFMEGLPTDFSTNGQLAAIASLFQEDDDSKENRIGLQQKYDVRQRRNRLYDIGSQSKLKNERRRSRREKPYQRPNLSAKKREATVGEASLFLKMWKL